MRRTLLLVLALLGTAGLAAAQGKWQATTVTGCLKESNGAYSLADSNSNTIYAVTGQHQQLQPMVNHEVSVDGKATTAVKSSAGMSENSRTGTLPRLRVDTIRSVSDTCENK